MAQTIDERIVEMRIDNEQFERGANVTLGTLAKLRQASDFGDLEPALRSVNVDFLADAFDGLAKRIDSSVNSIWSSVRRKLGEGVSEELHKVGKAIESMSSIGQIDVGFGKFGDKTKSVATLTAQGYELEKVNDLMEKLNWFTDETSYNFTDMVGNIAKFTATGQDLDKSVTAMEGIALWAAASGQGAQKASQAMYQLSQAMGKGALKYDDYKSIQNASMDTIEFRKQAVQAAEALGVLHKAADDTWEVVSEGKQFDLAGLFSSDALSRTQWFNSDVMMNVFNQYSKAVGEIERYMVEHDLDTASEAMKQLEAEAQNLAKTAGITLDEAFKQLGYDLDEFSLKVFKAGQEARSWGDVIDSVKDAVSTGWMKTFELMFGNAKEAIAFWSDLAERFYNIFAEGGNTRNKIFKIGFGIGEAEKSISGWARFENKIKDSGLTMEDFEKSCRKVIDATDNLALDNIIKEYGGLKEAFQQGAISGEQFKLILDDLNASTGVSLDSTVQDVEHVTQSFEELKEVAMGIIRGDYGNGSARKQMLEELGYNYDLVQAMAEIIYNGGQGYVGLTEELLQKEYPTYYAMLVESMESASAAVQNTNGSLADSDAILEDIQKNVVDLSGDVKEDIHQIKGSELFKGGLLNLLQIIEDIQNAGRDAYETVFGNVEERGRRVYQLLERFNKLTEKIQLSKIVGDERVATDALTRIQTHLENVYKVIEQLGGVALDAGGTLKKIGETAFSSLDRFFKGAFGKSYTDFLDGTSGLTDKLIDLLGSLRKEIRELGDNVQKQLPKIENAFERTGKTISPVLTSIKDIAKELWPVAKELFNMLKMLAGVGLDWLRTLAKGFLGKDFSSDVESFSKSVSGKLIDALKYAQDQIRSFSKTVEENVPNAKEKLTNIGASIRIFANSVFEAFPLVFQGVGKALITVTDFLGSVIPSLQPYTDGIREWITNMFGSATEEGERYLPEFSSIFERFKEIANNAFKGIYQQFGFEDFDAVNKALEEKFGAIWSTISTWWDNIKKFFSDLNLGGEGEGGFFSNIRSMFESFDLAEILAGTGKFAGAAMLDELFPTDSEIDEKTESFWGKLTTGLQNKFDLSGIFPSTEDIDAETTSFLGRLYLGIRAAFERIDWEQAFTIGKAVTFGAILFNINRFFNNLKVSVDPQKNGFLGIVDAIKMPFKQFSGLLTQMTNSVRKNAEGDQWIKLSVALGILAASLLALSTIDEQTLFNVASVMAGLMMLLKWIAASGNGLQIFSNNIKQVTKDVDSSVKLFDKLDFEKLKLKAFFENITLTGNVIPPAMGALIGIGVCIGVIGAIVIKLRDLKDINDIKPALVAVGIMLGGIVAALGILATFSSHLKGLGGVMIGVSLSFAIITHVVESLTDFQMSLKDLPSFAVALVASVLAFVFLVGTVGMAIEEISKQENINTGKLLGLAVVIGTITTAFMAISAAVFLLSMVDSGGVIAAGASLMFVAAGIAGIVWAISQVPAETSMLKAAASILLISLALQGMVIPIGILASLIEPLGWKLAIAAVGLAVFGFAMALILSALTHWEDKEQNILKAGAAMLAMAAALGIISLAVENLAGADITGIGAATIALIALSAVMTVLILALSKIESGKLMSTAIAMVTASTAVGVLVAALSALAVGFGFLVWNVPWDEFGEKAAAMAGAIKPIQGWIIGLTVVLAALVVGLSFAGDHLLKAGIGFAGVGAGVWLVIDAMSHLPEAIQGIVGAITVVKENAETLIEFAGYVLLAIMTVLIVHKAKLATTMVTLATTCANALSSAATLAKFGAAIKSIGRWLLAFIAMGMPGLTEKLITLLIGLIDGLANAINTHASEIAAAVEKAVIALLNVILQTFIRLFFDVIGGVAELINKALKFFGINLLGDDFNFFDYWHSDSAALADNINSDLNNIFDKVDETVESRGEQAGEKLMVASAKGVNENSGDLEAAADDAVNKAGDTANAGVGRFFTMIIGQGNTAAGEFGATGEAAGTNWSSMFSGAVDAADPMSAVREMFGQFVTDSESSGEEANEATWNAWSAANGINLPIGFNDMMSMLGGSQGFGGMEDILANYGGGMSGSLFGGYQDAIPEDLQAAMDETSRTLSSENDKQSNRYEDMGKGTAEYVSGSYMKEMDLQAGNMVVGTLNSMNKEFVANREHISPMGHYTGEKVSLGYSSEMDYQIPILINDTISGLEREVNNNIVRLANLGATMAATVDDSYKERMDQHSPSRVMEDNMGYTIEGLVVGAKEKGKRAFDAIKNVGNGMLDAMRNSMSLLALAVDKDYDIQPRITPVVDLGPASRGASALQSMMHGGALATALSGYNALGDLNVSGAVLNYTNQNAPVTSAIDGLSKKMDSFTKSLDQDRNFNVDIRVDQMAVRDESDIRAISKQLAKEVRVALRQKGKR